MTARVGGKSSGNGASASAVLHDHAGHRLDGLADFRRQAEALAEVELDLLVVLEGDHQEDVAVPPALTRQQALTARQRAGRREVEVEALGGASGGVGEGHERLRSRKRDGWGRGV